MATDKRKTMVVPDAIHHTDLGETLEYIQGWNDCRQAMLAEQPAQRTWVGLTDEDIEQACVPLGAAMLSITKVSRAIEAKLKGKNT